MKLPLPIMIEKDSLTSNVTLTDNTKDQWNIINLYGNSNVVS